MKLADVPWTQKIITMIQKKDVDSLHKVGFFAVSFRRGGYARVQADLKDVGISEAEVNKYTYTHTGAETRFYDYSWGKFTITICVPLEKVFKITKLPQKSGSKT